LIIIETLECSEDGIDVLKGMVLILILILVLVLV